MLYGGRWCRLTGSHGRSRVDRTLIEPSVWSGMPPGPVACISLKAASASFLDRHPGLHLRTLTHTALFLPLAWTMRRPVFLSHICSLASLVPLRPSLQQPARQTSISSCQSLQSSILENIVRSPLPGPVRIRAPCGSDAAKRCS